MAELKRSEDSTVGKVGDVWQLVVAYAKQETVEPVKGLGRFIGFGVAGAMLWGIGLGLLTLALLRVLQVETGSTFTGNLSWIPYLIVVAVGGAVIGVTLWRKLGGSR